MIDTQNTLKLFYKISDYDGFETTNSQNFKAIQSAMKDSGIYMNLKNGLLTIVLQKDIYHEKKSRSAGRSRKYVQVKYRSNEYGKHDLCRYSDVVWMSQNMTDQQLASEIGMKIATYYRHKKLMKESPYYQNLDKNRLSDREYLESLEGNYYF